MADPNNIQADKQYRTAIAERGKFWPVDEDYLTSIGYPASGEGKYATLTYQVNSSPLSLSGDIMVDLDSESVIGTVATDTVIQNGGIGELTIPVAVADGETVATWYDVYGAQVIAGYDTTLNAINVNVINSVASDSEASPSGEPANNKIVQGGGIAETTIPSPVSDGDAVATWFNEYGQQVIAGFNQSLNAIDVNTVNPAMLQRLGPITNLNAVTATGSGASVDVSNYHNFTVHIVSSAVTDGATIIVEQSIDGVNWAIISTNNIAADGVTEISISQQAYRYMRTSVSTRIDGTYSTYIYAGN